MQRLTGTSGPTPSPMAAAPNNWLSIFGGPAWEWDSSRRQYYMHNFLASQPDIKISHNADAQNAILDTVRFWLDRGVDGFRLDTVNFYFHDAQLRDNPPLSSAAEDGNFMGVDAPDTNPYGFSGPPLRQVAAREHRLPAAVARAARSV